MSPDPSNSPDLKQFGRAFATIVALDMARPVLKQLMNMDSRRQGVGG
jgi:hypothetical protein